MAAQHSEITVTFKDVGGLSSAAGSDRSSNPVADLDVLMRNLFKTTKKLHSDIRTWNHHANRDKADHPEPILEEVFEKVPSHKHKGRHRCDHENQSQGKDIDKN